MPGRDFSQKDMAELLGVSQMALVHWRKDGCPCRQVGHGWIYNTVATVDWIRARDRKSAEAPEAAEEKARLLRAQAELKEMDVAIRRGEIVEIAAVEKEWGEMVMRLRARLLQLPSRAAELSGMLPAAAAAKLRELINQALMELSSGKTKRTVPKQPKGKPPSRATA